MTRKIETIAKTRYFSKETKKAIGISIYTNGFEDGFMEALKILGDILEEKSNNLERINTIKEFLDTYGNERH